jgi:hypothetical protein
MSIQYCQNGDVIKKSNNQYACILRSNILGFTNGYVLLCFDGPEHSFPSRCLAFDSEFKDNWSLASPNITGQIGITNGSTGLYGNGTNFTEELSPGDKLIITDKQMCVDQIISATELTLTKKYNGKTLTNSNLWKLTL